MNAKKYILLWLCNKVNDSIRYLMKANRNANNMKNHKLDSFICAVQRWSKVIVRMWPYSDEIIHRPSIPQYAFSFDFIDLLAIADHKMLLEYWLFKLQVEKFLMFECNNLPIVSFQMFIEPESIIYIIFISFKMHSIQNIIDYMNPLGLDSNRYLNSLQNQL